MKRYNIKGDVLMLKQLSGYFRFDARELTHIQKVEMLYIHKHLVGQLQTTDIEDILAEIDRLRVLLKVRGKRRSLYPIFHHCQAQHMARVGEYDTSARRPPVLPSVGNYY